MTRHFKATNKATQQVVEYDADAPLTEHQGAAWDLDEVIASSSVAPTNPPMPGPVYEWTAFVFLRRFTQAERLAIRAARTSDPVLDDFFSLLEKADLVHSNDADMIAGMGYLAYLGLLTPARRDAILGSA